MAAMPVNKPFHGQPFHGLGTLLWQQRRNQSQKELASLFVSSMDAGWENGFGCCQATPELRRRRLAVAWGVHLNVLSLPDMPPQLRREVLQPFTTLVGCDGLDRRSQQCPHSLSSKIHCHV